MGWHNWGLGGRGSPREEKVRVAVSQTGEGALCVSKFCCEHSCS